MVTRLAGANAVWCTGFKGWFRARDNVRRDPLTVSDARSRCLLGCQIVLLTIAGVWPTFERLIRTYGLPTAMRYGSEFIARETDLWAYAHGVVLGLFRPGRPTDNTLL